MSREMTEDEVKKYIRGILTASPTTMTISRLQTEFNEMIGSKIPFHNFRYNSVEHFLKSIPDVCKVNGSGFFAVVTPVVTEKTAHINEMVTRQKVNIKYKSGGRRPKPTKRSAIIVSGASNYRKPISSSQNYALTPNTSYESSSSSSVGYYTPRSVQLSPKPFPSIQKIPQSGPFNSQNLTPFHHNIPTPKTTAVQPQQEKSCVPNHLSFGSPLEDFTNKFKTNNTNSNVCENKEIGQVSSSNYETNRSYTSRNICVDKQTTEPRPSSRISYSDEGTSRLATESQNSYSRKESISPISRAPQNKVQNSKKLGEGSQLQEERRRLQLDSLIRKQEELGNIKPATSSTSTLSRIHPPSKPRRIPDNAPILDPDDEKYYTEGGSLDYKNKNKEVASNFESVIEHEDRSNVPKRVQNNLRKLISEFENGIWCADIPANYRRLFGKDLLYMDYGYPSLIEMCVALKDIFHYVRPERDDFKLYDRSKPLPDTVEKNFTMASYEVDKTAPDAPLPDLEWTDFERLIPNDVFKFGNEIPKAFLPESTSENDIFDVVVVEIFDPSKFWFNMGKYDKDAPLEAVMDEIQTFYRDPENAKEYAIPPVAIKEGLYCVQVIYGEYHRARIVKVFPDNPDYVRVYYIDYGTVAKATVKGLCFLHSKFAELPAQALRCRLADIVPELKGHPWPRQTSERFRELVNRTETKIKITHINWDEEYLCVYLADVTNVDSVVYINEVLVNEGLALWDNETQVVRKVDTCFKSKVQSLHLFPTFVELEYGLAPSSADLYSLEDMLVPIYFCIPQYFELDDEAYQTETDEEIEHKESCFIENVKNNRKFTPLHVIDVSNIINPPAINFDLFGDLKEEMIEFCSKNKVTSTEPGNKQNKEELCEEEAFCDVEVNQESSLENFEAVKLLKEDRELSESIIRKLEQYRLLEEEGSSNSDKCQSVPNNITNKTSSASPVVDWTSNKPDLSHTELIEHELSTILEQSDLDSLSSDSEPVQRPILGSVDTNFGESIFDRSDGSSGKSEGHVTPKSFLRTVQKRCMIDEDEEDEGGVNCNAMTMNAHTSSMNPFLVDTPTDEAVETLQKPDSVVSEQSFTKCTSKSSTSSLNPDAKPFIQTQCKVGNLIDLDTSSTDLNLDTQHFPESQDTGTQSASEQIDSANLIDADDAAQQKESIDLIKSFLMSDRKELVEQFLNSIKERNAKKRERKLKKAHSDICSVKQSETSDDFISSLNLNNPFRPYLEEQKKKFTVDMISSDSLDGAASDKTSRSFRTVNSKPSNVSPTNDVIKPNIKYKEQALSVLTSSSGDSDYKEFVPRSAQTEKSFLSDQVSVHTQATAASFLSVRHPGGIGLPPRIGTPPGMATPPRLFTPPPIPNGGYNMPMGCPPYQYPQWSNAGCTAGYPPWSNGAPPMYGPPPPLGPGPYPNYAPPPKHEGVRPPPGFAPIPPTQQGYPPNFNPYIQGRPMAPPPMYGNMYQGPPMYFAPSRPVLYAQNIPPQPNQKDFYEIFNEQKLVSNEKPK